MVRRQARGKRLLVLSAGAALTALALGGATGEGRAGNAAAEATRTYTAFFKNDRGYRYQLRVVLRSPPAVAVRLGDPGKLWLDTAPTFATLTVTNRTPGRTAPLSTTSGSFAVLVARCP